MELRKRSLNPSSEVPHKRSPSKKLKKGVTRIEDLSGELWFELFAYFDGHLLVHSFSGLNSSIESFLSDYRLPIHLNLSAKELLPRSPLTSQQIVSLDIDCNHLNMNQLLDLCSFIRLRSLSLRRINDEQLQQLSQVSWEHLRQISIQSKAAKDILRIIVLYFPRVKRVVLDSMGKEFLVKPSDLNKGQTEVESLALNGRIKLAKLFRLWPWIPRLRSLSIISDGVHQCDYWVDEKIISRQNFPPHLSSLRLTICDDDMSFSNLERLIPKTVRYLTIVGSMADDDLDDYLSPTNWLRLMSNCSDTLRRIELDISSYFDPSDASGLQKTLAKFRKNPFFRQTTIQSKNFFITVQGSIEKQ